MMASRKGRKGTSRLERVWGIDKREAERFKNRGAWYTLIDAAKTKFSTEKKGGGGRKGNKSWAGRKRQNSARKATRINYWFFRTT